MCRATQENCIGIASLTRSHANTSIATTTANVMHLRGAKLVPVCDNLYCHVLCVIGIRVKLG